MFEGVVVFLDCDIGDEDFEDSIFLCFRILFSMKFVENFLILNLVYFSKMGYYLLVSIF